MHASMGNRLGLALAWIELVVSFLIAGAMIWGYLTFQPPLSQIVRSVASSIGAVSQVLTRTADTVAIRTQLISQTAEMLVVADSQMKELAKVTVSQIKAAPTYAEALKATSDIAGQVGGSLQNISDAMQVEVPSGLRMDGARPTLVKSKPFERTGEAFRQQAVRINEISKALDTVSIAISRDAKTVGVAVEKASAQASTLIAEIGATLDRLKESDLPKAVSDLNLISRNLKELQFQVDQADRFGVYLLAIGLLISSWLFLSSLGTLSSLRAAQPPI